MQTFLKYFYEILTQFFSGFAKIFSGLVEGFKMIFDFNKYLKITGNYKGDFSISEWVLFGIAAFILLILLILVLLGIIFIFKRIFRFRKTLVEQESMLDEIGELNSKVATLPFKSEISSSIDSCSTNVFLNLNILLTINNIINATKTTKISNIKTDIPNRTHSLTLKSPLY